jgi:hypothetical protein
MVSPLIVFRLFPQLTCDLNMPKVKHGMFDCMDQPLLPSRIHQQDRQIISILCLPIFPGSIPSSEAANLPQIDDPQETLLL